MNRPLIVLLTSLLSSATWSAGADIPGLFNTGIGTDGSLLGPSGQVDPHYRLVESADPNDVGPDAVTLNPGFPVGPWIAEGEGSEFPDSRWIAPRAAQNLGSSPGVYRYQTTFDLTGFDPTTVTLVGRWATDDGGLEVLINGEDAFLTSNGFGGWTEFEITEGFVSGENVLEFAVDNGGAAANPTGLRVEFLEATGDLTEGAAPNIVTEPQSRRVIAGDTVVLDVAAGGTPPLSYQWTLDGQPVGGGTDRTLTLADISLDQAGDYRVTVSNSVGEDTSAAATIDVLARVPGLFATGVDGEGQALDDLSVDPHYRLVVNPDGASEEAIVHDSQVFPIVDGPWLANTETSKWIAPRGDTAEAAGGDYVYRLTFDLTGFRPATTLVRGRWASDNQGLAIRVNGADVGLRNDAGFGAFTSFRIENGPFISGINTLDFVINNAGAGPTALRIDGLAAGAEAGEEVSAPTFVVEPEGVEAFRGETVTLRSLADGTPPLTYTWKQNGEVVGSNANLELGAIQPEHEGSYVVEVSNAQGTEVSTAVNVTVLEPAPGLFATGVDDQGQPLADFEPDPHYQLISDPNDEALEAIVLNSTVFPIVAGPWIPNNARSKWIGVQEDNNGAPGEYVYRLTFDLSAFDPEEVFVEGDWAADDGGGPLLLNGNEIAMRDGPNFTALTRFRIEDGFVQGLNTLDFPVANGGADVNPTGLKVENLRGGGPTEDPNLIGPLGSPFGQLADGNPVTKTVVLRNSGRTQTLAITNIRIVGENAANFSLGEVPTELAPAEAATLEVRVDPEGQTGNFAASLEITTNDPSTPVQTFDISAFLPISPNLVAHYRMDETAGTQLVDASGFGRHGVYNAAQGTLTLNQEPLATGTSASFSGGALAEAGPGVLPAFENFSISLWYTGTDTGAAASIVSRGEGQGDPFALVASGNTLFWFTAGGDPALTLENVLTPGTAHHIVVTVADNQSSVYIDGSLAAEGPSESFADNSQNPLQFGAANGILGIDGRLDDIQIYNVSLTADAIAGLFADPGSVVGSTGPEPGGSSELEISLSPAQDEITLSWKTGDGTLTTSTDLIEWSPVADAPVTNGEQLSVTQPLEGERYFRLEP